MDEGRKEGRKSDKMKVNEGGKKLLSNRWMDG